jgi:DNA-binding Lrp family transcriptional regulator
MAKEGNEINMIRVDFECNSVPTYYYTANQKWVEWGKENAYPYYLMTLYNRNAYHGSILKSKVEYVYGKGLTYNSDNLTVEQQAIYQDYLSSANDYDSWDDVFRKNIDPLEIVDGIAMEIVWKINGKCDVFSMNPLLFRSNPDGSEFYYCEAWTDENGKPTVNPEKHSSFRVFKKFDPSKRNGVQVLFYKVPKLTVVEFGNLYPQPNYIQILQDIETDIEITNFHYSNLKNGMSASSIVSLFNGEPERPEKKKIAELFKNNHTGSNNAGKFILNFVDKNGQPADIKTLTSSDLDKQFEQLAKRLQQNIFTGHGFDPILGGIETEGKLGGAKEVLEKFDKFLKTYIQYRQKIHLDLIKYIGQINGVDLSELEVKQTTPVMESLPSDPNIFALFDTDTLKNYFAKRYGIDIEENSAEVQKMEALPINENVKKLTGREYQKLQNLISKYKNGKATYEEVAFFIKSYGLGEDYIKLVLGEKKFSSDKEELILKAFEANAIDDNDDEIIKTEFVGFKSKIEVLEHEFKNQRFASIRSQVLEILKGSIGTPLNQIAKQLGITEEEVNNVINDLIAKELLIDTAAGLGITSKGLNTKNVDIEYETYTVYEYVTRPEVPEAKQSRNFCKRLLALSRNGKRWTKEGIDSITNQFGEDAWTYRGGFYSNPQTLETTPYCRHIWRSLTKTRRKK